MPYQDPGHLTEAEYLALTAFLAYRHDVWDGQPLTAERLAQVRLRPAAAATPTPAGTPEPPHAPGSPDDQEDAAGSDLALAAAAVAAVALLLVGGLLLWQRSRA
jgi:hypothetical protein